MNNLSRSKIRQAYLEPESVAIARLLGQIQLSDEDSVAISAHASKLIISVRNSKDPGVMQAFLAEYGLSTDEGIALMCLAEALLRVPDAETIDQLIQDKIVPNDWASHIGDSGSILVNASTWALMLTGRILEDEGEGVVGALQGMLRSLGEPVVRVAVERAMREMAEQFVLGQSIEDAAQNGDKRVGQGYTYSYDMLGEAALTELDAEKYHSAYLAAIEFISGRAHSEDLRNNPGVSVKLSAIHPRYSFTQRTAMLPKMCDGLLRLCQAAKAAGVGLNIDAEEADRLDLSLDIIERVLLDRSLQSWHGFGVVVQAYGQRASYLIDWLYDLAAKNERQIMVRLVKGAYWDTEVKRAQELGLSGYPVFTRKASTDISYIACANQLLAMRDRIYPQFATHNAHTIATILKLAGDARDDFEFQRLHGMGDALHHIVKTQEQTRCRIYAPVGTHEDLLAYLVRRLLENGANSSFVNQIVDQNIAPEFIAADPVRYIRETDQIPNPRIPLPRNIYPNGRINSQGWDINDALTVEDLEAGRQSWLEVDQWHSELPAGIQNTAVNKITKIHAPHNPDEVVGRVIEILPGQVDDLVHRAHGAWNNWSQQEVEARSQCLHDAASLFEQNAPELFALLGREAGKTLEDAIAELREAVDFLRYYAITATVVENETTPRGVLVCISPWNFPLAIFTGQIAAALVTGNTVIAKPAEQTPLIAARAAELLHLAGIPSDVLSLAQGPGETVGAHLVSNPNIAGVCFTGSTAVAQIINRQLALSGPEDAMLVAETGGINAMIVDSTALLEQAVGDIIVSAFRSAGQRCSALRIVYVQEDIMTKLLTMLKGAMQQLVLGDPLDLVTDVGPVIDEQARESIQIYIDQQQQKNNLLFQISAPKAGFFIAPCLIKITCIKDLQREIFGPVLHVTEFSAGELNQVIADINAAGYGLTFGLHSRIDSRVQHLVSHLNVGNFYVNRNQIGAIVGSQPFGGEGLSGTGPKAGGPHYLRRFRKGSEHPIHTLPIFSSNAKTLDVERALNDLEQRSLMPRAEVVSHLREMLRGRAPQAMAAAAALDMGPLDLPGPTGEANQLTLHPLGVVVCLSNDPDCLLDRVIQGLRCGNKVLACGKGAGSALNHLSSGSLPLVTFDEIPDPAVVTELVINAVSLDATIDCAAWRRILADRPGPIVRIIDQRYYPAAYGLERSLCIDTTAAGGNAALLADSA